MIEGLSREMGSDDKHMTTTVYGNGPGYQIVGGVRPDVNESVAGMRLTSFRNATMCSSCTILWFNTATTVTCFSICHPCCLIHLIQKGGGVNEVSA